MNQQIDILLAKESFIKMSGAGHGKYIIYNREWLFEHLEEEFEFLKQVKKHNQRHLQEKILKIEDWMEKLTIEDDE